ncbi:hypothetical protein MALV_00010 [Mycolicibacterium alvei]|uniref:MobA-like NTP transferase domain-containing protein n=1 Tax=Mycolicibacterium alvei TaxID=67081 RepID=A0A6N4UI88_9MYCO|nr:hypothetical protein MALV_00010 [Mycolicibacterium alvei]
MRTGFVIAAPGQPLPELRAEVLRDEVRGVGPLVATGRGLRAVAEAGLERAFVCAVDMPYLNSELIGVLAAAADRVPADIVLPWDGRAHYLAGIYRSALTEQIAVRCRAQHARAGRVRRYAADRDATAASADQRQHGSRSALSAAIR